MQVRVTKVEAVRPHGDNLSIVTVDGHEVVANRREDGSFRWQPGEPCIYIPEGAIIPDDVLKERFYWDMVKDRGMLEGKRGNRVKMRRFAGHESRGLLFKVGLPGGRWEDPEGKEYTQKPFWIDRGNETIDVDFGDDVAEFLGITEHVPA